ncbi:MAG: hypothetical protein US57_C0006G0006 [Candidatus Moranbacteria bacterium GW2011_GWC2_37_73]|nr:MAG: hypothetical protein UR95_C0007G0010 [Parcubacteria group bacterium GW2011_GWC1_36_108]KKQ00061.1 MAG: hypothetical protein US09_C0022G0007 [Candidatus Moranbacteria bacterium GW2011_GWD1_36_198]KKQ01157.1 MAG: hypothetical protein US10_C0021G0015 [Candidatus Moranbacteria bacterium GW2011_GWD2_36_198]KKQ39934.1 MAG: hypothetical protein US57_C0006G0006 [Candidatus Moranbacteria bacterium GW2011_GWC2_37_73]HAR99683.1 hypothetical protein [Candidatus Moranbacteria bacterium]
MNLKRVSIVHGNKLREFIDKNSEIRTSKGMIAATERAWELQWDAVSGGDQLLFDHKIVKLLHDAARISFYFSMQGGDAITLSMCTFNSREREASCIYHCAFGIMSGKEVSYI